jgi:ABC-type lipopolysaccharide export system ATPase subunit
MQTISLERLGRLVAEAVAAGDKDRLEAACVAAGTYRVLVAAAAAAGVDAGSLEDLLYEI